MIKFIAHKNIKQTEQQQANEDENTTERPENKENRSKILWAAELDMILPVIYATEQGMSYPPEPQSAHLAWVQPVPTPPPTNLI